jgi:two-component system response regulator PilR (NtrC family)
MSGFIDRRALIVEDDSSSREALATFLRRRGVEVDCAATLAVAESKLTDDVTHLILDLRLPDGSGLALLERAQQGDWPVKVAIVTGIDRGDLLAEVALRHPDVFLRKPIDFTDVLGWMEGRPLPPPAAMH